MTSLRHFFRSVLRFLGFSIPQRILFVCSGNTCRSPMAAALFNSRGPKGWLAESAGMNASTGSSASKFAELVTWDAVGADLRWHRARHIRDVNFSLYDRIISLNGVRRGLPESAEIINVQDPFGGSELRYRKTFDEIAKALGIQQDWSWPALSNPFGKASPPKP